MANTVPVTQGYSIGSVNGNGISVGIHSGIGNISWTNTVEDDPKTTVIKGELELNGVNVNEFINSVSKRLLILEEDFTQHEQYPALKAAYEQYKTIEKLLDTNDNKTS
jgi:hypothetical protein